MRLLYITYKVDPHDTLVGHVVGWVAALAGHMEHVHVVCLAAAAANLPANVTVHSLGKEQGVSRWRRWAQFYRIVWALRQQIDAVFCQFSPEYVIGVAPIAWLRGWPLTLWYTHRHVGLRLRLATALASRVVTATPDSFRLDTPKLRVIGHGIDTERFRPPAERSDGRPTVLAVGRRSPIKHYELLIDAVQILVDELGRDDLEVRIVGGDEGNAPAEYAHQLQRRIDAADLTRIVKLVGAVPFEQVVAEYQRAHVHVNLCPTGGMDKAVLEGMACGVPTLVRNETFRALLDESASDRFISTPNAREVAHKIDALLGQSPRDRRQLQIQARRSVVQYHSLEAFIEKLATVLGAS